MEKTISEVGFTEVSQVDERDTTQIEAHHECISCHLFLRREILDRLQTLDLADGFCRNSPFTGWSDTSIDFLEGMLLWSKPFYHCLVIGGTEDSEIEGTGVAAYLCRMVQVRFIRAHHFCIYLIQGNVLVVKVSLNTVERCLVMLHGAVLTVLHQQGDEEVHELE